LHQMGHLERIFTCLPWWKADKESREQAIPRDLISCNFLMQGMRRVGRKMPFYTKKMDFALALQETRFFSKWVARNLPECDAYIGISGSGLHAGKLAISRGAGYIMDRGSTHIRHANDVLNAEYGKWGIAREVENEWLMCNEEAETAAATLITVPSHFVMRTFVAQGVAEEKLRVVPYGVSLREFYPVGEASANEFRILFVGNFSIRKGAPYLLEAFKQLQHPKKILTIVGGVADDIKGLLGNYSQENIEFIGAVPRADVKRYMSTAAVLVLPSIEEGLALVQAQALACGCPIIATPNTGSETLFDNGKEGIIVEAMQVASILNALELLCDDWDLRQQMSTAALEKAKSFGGWASYANGMLAVAAEAKSIVSK